VNFPVISSLGGGKAELEQAFSQGFLSVAIVCVSSDSQHFTGQIYPD